MLGGLMVGTIKFFQYNMRPKDIVMSTMTPEEIRLKKQEKLKHYEDIYKNGFCKAYGIECKKDDVQNFLYLVEKRIINRHNPEGVDYRPVGSMVRLWIAPRPSYIQLGVSSHDIKNDYDKEFNKFKGTLIKSSKKSDTLENIVK